MSNRLASVLSAEIRAGIFHFTVFLSMGVSSVYFAIWLSEQGISSEQIGLINALPVLIMLGVNLFIGRLADRASDWRSVIAILALIAGAVPIGLFLVDEFWGILLVWAMVAISAGSIPPLIDAATVRMTQRNGSDFGAVRAWGTVGYLAASSLAGFVIAGFGPDAFLPLFVALSLLRALAALQLPRFRAPSTPGAIPLAKVGAAALREVLRPWFILPVLAFAMLSATHALLASFAALVWHSEGIGEGTIGQLIAVAAAAEALMMFVLRRAGFKITARHMILAAGAATVLRWTVMAFNPPVEVLFLLQTLHAITYAVGYFGLVLFIANWTSEDIAAEAQGFAFVLAQAITVVTLLAFGPLFDAFGSRAFLFASGLGAIGIVCVLISLRLRPAK